MHFQLLWLSCKDYVLCPLVQEHIETNPPFKPLTIGYFEQRIVRLEWSIHRATYNVGKRLIIDDIASVVIYNPAVAIIPFLIHHRKMIAARNCCKVFNPARIIWPCVIRAHLKWIKVVVLDCTSVAFPEIIFFDHCLLFVFYLLPCLVNVVFVKERQVQFLFDDKHECRVKCSLNTVTAIHPNPIRHL